MEISIRNGLKMLEPPFWPFTCSTVYIQFLKPVTDCWIDAESNFWTVVSAWSAGNATKLNAEPFKNTSSCTMAHTISSTIGFQQFKRFAQYHFCMAQEFPSCFQLAYSLSFFDIWSKDTHWPNTFRNHTTTKESKTNGQSETFSIHSTCIPSPGIGCTQINRSFPMTFNPLNTWAVR